MDQIYIPRIKAELFYAATVHERIESQIKMLQRISRKVKVSLSNLYSTTVKESYLVILATIIQIL